MKISTHKTSSGALVTTVSVNVTKDGFETFRMFPDYMVRAAVTKPARITEKVVHAQHREVLAEIEAFVVRAEAHNLTIPRDK